MKSILQSSKAQKYNKSWASEFIPQIQDWLNITKLIKGLIIIFISIDIENMYVDIQFPFRIKYLSQSLRILKLEGNFM